MKKWTELTDKEKLHHGEAFYEFLREKIENEVIENYDIDDDGMDATQEFIFDYQTQYFADRVRTFQGDWNRFTQDEHETTVVAQVTISGLDFLFEVDFVLPY